ncbi:MAG: hypothetical protein ISR65_00260 [Bacteriovoracaceae bacterium]|nr:hypothetical protein [Bacteriovoracaceae bacterium]
MDNFVTTSFIGSDKNAGKTTVLSFVYNQIKQHSSAPVIITSIGINSEKVDSLEGHQKPIITIKKGDSFVTSVHQLKDLSGRYEILDTFSTYVSARALVDIRPVLEGPNTKKELIAIKQSLKKIIPRGTLLIDGSIDRQFLADPIVSDQFYFSLLISERQQQLNKAQSMIYSLSLPTTENKIKNVIENHKNDFTKSMIISSSNKIIYHSLKIPFLDDHLKDLINKQSKPHTLYLNAAFSKSVDYLLKQKNNVNIVLDNFTLYQLAQTQSSVGQPLNNLSLLNPVKARALFIKQVNSSASFKIPLPIKTYNLYREDVREIRI